MPEPQNTETTTIQVPLPPLPGELYLLVIDALGHDATAYGWGIPEEDVRQAKLALQQCALVCSIWRPRAQRSGSHGGVRPGDHEPGSQQSALGGCTRGGVRGCSCKGVGGRWRLGGTETDYGAIHEKKKKEVDV